MYKPATAVWRAWVCSNGVLLCRYRWYISLIDWVSHCEWPRSCISASVDHGQWPLCGISCHSISAYELNQWMMPGKLMRSSYRNKKTYNCMRWPMRSVAPVQFADYIEPLGSIDLDIWPFDCYGFVIIITRTWLGYAVVTCQKIISEAYCSLWTVSSMFNVAEIILNLVSAAEIILK